MSERSASARFSIGDWQVHPAAHQITRNGQRIVVEPQVMEVLTYLAHHAGEVISHDELIDKLWRGTIVAEGAIYQNIAKLRHALNDDPNDPRYIETIPRGGYRLIGDVGFIEDDDRVESQSRFFFFTQLTNYKLAVVFVIAPVLGLVYIGYEKLAVDRTPEELSATRIIQSEDINESSRWQKSIAVLPFVNMTGDPDNEYFSDGLSEEILTLLATTPELKVIGRTSSFSFKGKNEDLRVIGQTLDVNTVLEGSVRKSGDQIRITAQLVDVSDGAHIWSESFDRTMTDIFAVQDDVAAAIIDALQVHVSANPTRGRPTENSEAYALFLKAKSLISGFHYTDAEELLLLASEIDPKFAEAYELLAANYFHLAGNIIKAAEGQMLMGEAAAKALAIDPDLVLARALYQAGNVENWSYAREIEAFERAVRKHPNNPELLYGLAWDLSVAGYLREALGIAKRYADLDPLLQSANIRFAEALYAVGSTSEATAILELQIKLGNDDAAVLLGLSNLTAKQDDIAIEYFEASGWQSYFWDTNSVREFVSRARDPLTGQAFLDRHLSQVVASVPEEHAFRVSLDAMPWYLYFGYLDRYFELILATDLNASYWADADMSIKIGTRYRRLGFTAHPKYLEVAEAVGIMDVWEQRGPPDFCEKVDGQWVCE